jgi:hypothetical protein
MSQQTTTSPLVYSVADLRRLLKVGEWSARKIMRRAGRRLADRKWVVTPAALTRYLEGTFPSDSERSP